MQSAPNLYLMMELPGIVGPNGCGKSNIVDSIRWVLGEQRTRNLRSDKMENIIFNGTQNKRKANFAEVSLTFENTRNLLPTEYSNISITRKLYRSGESEYQINGVTCRLKDIHNLFMDTGISSDSYAIIELRMVDEILTNKDNERRRFLEEAAGISKYKIRKRQTLKRLKDTDDDLERVEDLLFEIEKNLKSLEKQARRTQRYFELKEKYKVISSQYAFLMMRSIRERQRQIQILEQSLTDQQTAIQSGMANREAGVQAMKKDLLDHEKTLSAGQADLNQHIRNIQGIETEKSIKNERLKYLQQRETAIRDQIDTERQQMDQKRSAILQLREQVFREQQASDSHRRTTEGHRTEMERLRKQQQEVQQITDSISEQYRHAEQELQSLTRDKEIKRVQIQSLEAELNRAQEDRDRRSGDLDAFAEKSEQLTAETTAFEQQFSELEARKIAHEEETHSTDELYAKLKDAVYKTNRILDAKQNEFNLTKSLVENLEGFPTSVKFLKKNAKWIKDAPLLSDVFAVPDAYKIALESFLDPYLSYYVVPTREDAILAVHMLADSAKGRANFFILDELDSYQPQTPILFTQAQSALDIVEFAPEYKKLAAFLLDRLYLVNEETDLPEEIPEKTVFMTRAGNLSRRRFILGGGSLGLFEGKRLGRAKNLEKLEKEIGKLQKKLTSEKVELDHTAKKLESLKRTNYSKELENLRKQLTEKQRDLSVLQLREKEHKEFLERVGKRSENLHAELQNLRTQLESADPKIKIQSETLLQLGSQLESQKGQLSEQTDQLNKVTQLFNEANIRMIQLINQVENLSRELTQNTRSIEQYEGNAEKLNKDLAQVQEDIDKLIGSNLQDDETMMRLYNQKKEMERQVGVLEERVAQTRNGIYQLEESLSQDRKKRDALLQKQTELKEQATEVRIELNGLRERMSVEFQVEIGELSEIALFDKPSANYDLQQIEGQLHKTRERVQNFGEINPMAVEAFNEIKERFDFISGQKKDLQEAKNSLLETIAEIDQTAKEKFLETFSQVRTHFMEVFRSLFSEDDKCDLILLDEDNPLESDVNIIARPKGKRPLTIKQLSGGEKTLTAVALLFSIYLIKPAPFCIFDEVDAPLDDANIDKFNNIIRDFSKTSQFIIVTHNKRTMAATNIMYGVTMQNTGISSIAPVDLETIFGEKVKS